MKTNVHFLSYLAHFWLEREMFQTKVAEKIETHLLSSINFFFGKSCRLWGIVEKYDRPRQATDGSIIGAHACCMVDT